jgi:hypothetical protein
MEIALFEVGKMARNLNFEKKYLKNQKSYKTFAWLF